MPSAAIVIGVGAHVKESATALGACLLLCRKPIDGIGIVFIRGFERQSGYVGQKLDDRVLGLILSRPVRSAVRAEQRERFDRSGGRADAPDFSQPAPPFDDPLGILRNVLPSHHFAAVGVPAKRHRHSRRKEDRASESVCSAAQRQTSAPIVVDHAFVGPRRHGPAARSKPIRAAGVRIATPDRRWQRGSIPPATSDRHATLAPGPSPQGARHVPRPSRDSPLLSASELIRGQVVRSAQPIEADQRHAQRHEHVGHAKPIEPQQRRREIGIPMSDQNKPIADHRQQHRRADHPAKPALRTVGRGNGDQHQPHAQSSMCRLGKPI